MIRVQCVSFLTHIASPLRNKAVNSVSGKIFFFQCGSIQQVNTLCGQNAELLEVTVGNIATMVL